MFGKKIGKKNTAKRSRGEEIFPDEIFADSHNSPAFDTDQFEGRLDQPISRTSLFSIGIAALLVVLVFAGRAWYLEIHAGTAYAKEATENTLESSPIFATRGVIYDRNGVPLAWNAPPLSGTTTEDQVAHRVYATSTGLAPAVGYVQYPAKDSHGFYYQNDFIGLDGAEKYFNDELQGTNGSRLIEADARGAVVSENVVEPPTPGQNITLSIDSRLQSGLYDNIADIASRYHFTGGAGVIMDIHTGEVMAMVSYPDYDPQVMSDKDDQAAVKAQLAAPDQPFLDRAIGGLYTPGSIVKPYEAMGVLNENIIDPSTVIVTTGSISIPNPYDPSEVAVFHDWKDLGSLDLRHAIAMSSDAYFYIVGGGYKDQPGLGVSRIDNYMHLFGFGSSTDPGSFFYGPAGLVPSPAWKLGNTGEDWYLGDTYHTAIGQYSWQVTPIQVIRAIAAMANEGTLLEPTILKDSTPIVDRTINLPQADFDIVHQGMRLGVESGVATALNVPYVDIAAKSGTAELGVSKANVNSWITGFWPYENPKYAFAVTLEHGSVSNLVGAAAAMRGTLDWMNKNTPEYFQ